MTRLTLFAFLSLLAAAAPAARHVGFETDAFSRAYPVSYPWNAVFSPASFEIDCALVAESLATIPKANVSELLNVSFDFPSTYRPVVDGLGEPTNGFSFVAARAFCVPSVKTVRAEHRHHLSQEYGAEVLRGYPNRGAESWFRATMGGEMESFALSPDGNDGERFSFYDLVSVKAAWKDPFPTANTRSLAFRPDGGTGSVQVVCMSDVRLADTWETSAYTLLKLPLRGDAWFYAMLPKEGQALAAARADLTSAKIDRLLAVTRSVAESGVGHGACAIVLPRLDLFSRLDVTGIFRYFRIPTGGLVHISENGIEKEYVQYVRFRLAEHGDGEPPLVKKAEGDVVPVTPDVKRLVFNRPFLFFVYHEKTATIPVAGQFTGRCAL